VLRDRIVTPRGESRSGNVRALVVPYLDARVGIDGVPAAWRVTLHAPHDLLDPHAMETVGRE
jgi:hypothetical protein